LTAPMAREVTIRQLRDDWAEITRLLDVVVV
jgi:hypothetical protein